MLQTSCRKAEAQNLKYCSLKRGYSLRNFAQPMSSKPLIPEDSTLSPLFFLTVTV